jgi:hypothetical protein
MSVIAAAVKHMLANGMPHEAIVAAIAEMETGRVVRSSRQERNARYYADHKDEIKAKASERRLKASEPTETRLKPTEPAAPTLPNPLGSNITPPKGGDDNYARDPHRMPAGFKLTEEDRQFARDLGWTDAEIADEEAGFVDYWSNPKLPGSKALKTNWSATWRNRIRDLSKRRGHGAHPNGAQHSFRVVNGSNGHVQASGRSAAQFLRADIERELREAGGEGERIRGLELLPQFGRG